MGRNVFPVVFDGHNDVLDRLGRLDGGGPAAFFERGEKGHLDLPRAREGGFGGGIFAVWVPSPKTPERTPRELPPALDAAYALRYALAAVAMLFRIEDRSDGEFRVVRTAAEIERCLDEEAMPAVLHFEGADAIDPDLDALHVLYQAGLRVQTTLDAELQSAANEAVDRGLRRIDKRRTGYDYHGYKGCQQAVFYRRYAVFFPHEIAGNHRELVHDISSVVNEFPLICAGVQSKLHRTHTHHDARA